MRRFTGVALHSPVLRPRTRSSRDPHTLSPARVSAATRGLNDVLREPPWFHVTGARSGFGHRHLQVVVQYVGHGSVACGRSRFRSSESRGSQWPTYQHIDYAVDDGILTITLDRPDRLNAFTSRMGHELCDAFDESDADDAVRAVVITGRGRAFSAGMDLGGGSSTFDVESKGGPSVDEYRDAGGVVTLRMFASKKPIIAAVNGAAVGVGATMTLAADVRLASEHARYGFVFSRRGLPTESNSSWFLPRIVGISQALDWCFAGELIDAAEARRGGLVKAVLPADELLPAASALAHRWADGTSAVSIAVIRVAPAAHAGGRAPHGRASRRVAGDPRARQQFRRARGRRRVPREAHARLPAARARPTCPISSRPDDGTEHVSVEVVMAHSTDTCSAWVRFG